MPRLAPLAWCALAAATAAASQTGASRFNVKDYGAAGNGSADDQGAIQAAAAAAAKAGGGIVWLPPGIYAHGDVLNFGSNVTLSGAGPGETTVRATNAERSAIRFANASNCGVSDLKISGAASPRKQNDDSAGILLVDSSNCSIHGVAIDGGASAGILVHGSHGIRVTGNDIRNEMADGVHVVAGSTDVLVESNTAENTGDDSFAAVAYGNGPQTTGVTIRNNTSSNSRARGVSCIGAADCVISGNKISNPRGHGIAVAFEQAYQTHHPRHASVSGNVIDGAGGRGMNAILVDGAEDVRIGGNQVSGSNSLFIHNSAGVDIEETTVRDARGPAILARDSSSVRLRRNHLVHATGPGILLERVRGGEVSGNHVESAGGDDRGGIDIAESSRINGDGNTIRKAGGDGRAGRVRVAGSDQVDVRTSDQ